MKPVIFVAIVGFGSLPSRILPLLAEIIAEHTSTVKFVIKSIVDIESSRQEAAREGLEKNGLQDESVQYLNDLKNLHLVKICREAASIGGSVLIFDYTPTAIHLDHCIYYLSLIKEQELNNLYVLIEKPLLSASPDPELENRLNDLLDSMEEQRIFVNACELFSPVMETLLTELTSTAAHPISLVEFKAYRKNSIGLSAFLESDFTRLGPLLGSTVCQDKGWHDLINLLACLWVTLDSPAQQLKDAKWRLTEQKRILQPYPGKKEAFVSAAEPSFTSDPRLAASAQSQLVGWVQIAEQKTTTLHLESDWVFAGDNFAFDLERQLDQKLVSERLIPAQIPYFYRDFRFAESTFSMDHTELAFRMSFLSNLDDSVLPLLSRLNHSGRWEKIPLRGDLRGGMKDSYKSVINRILGKENGQFPEHLPLELILKAEQVLIKAFHDNPPPEVSDSKLRLRECVKKALSGPD